MGYNFDKIIDRTNTDSIKYDFAKRRGMPKEILPMWVADMDFAAPDEVIEALTDKSQHGIFGYSEGREDYFEAIADWYRHRFNWEVKKEWLLKTPGVVYAVTTAIHAFTKPGDGVLIQEPVYYPFKESIEINDRKTVVNELVYSDGGYGIDFIDFEERIVEQGVKLFILCSPHNPVGRVWTKDELEAMGEICLRHKVIIVADEIHGDFTYPGHTHLVFAKLQQAFEAITITCTSPSKTFNLAGLQISNVFIIDRSLRRQFRDAITKSGYSQPNIMGLVACKAAYKYGQQWLEDLKIYLQQNLNFFRDFLEKYIPDARLIEPQGTYLVWVDFSKLQVFKGMSHDEIDRFMIHKASLWLDGGTMFGAGGEGFQRFNIACPRATLEKALNQLKDALERA